MTPPTPPRKQWFLDRIGTTVYPTRSMCNCYWCGLEYEGIFLDNMHKALEVYSNELLVENTHFETKEQRDEHARTNPN